jgi:hypothetical protein
MDWTGGFRARRPRKSALSDIGSYSGLTLCNMARDFERLHLFPSAPLLVQDGRRETCGLSFRLVEPRLFCPCFTPPSGSAFLEARPRLPQLVESAGSGVLRIDSGVSAHTSQCARPGQRAKCAPT